VAPLLLAVALAAAAPLEYGVKAAYLLGFTRYVEWPAFVFPAEGAPLVLCVIGPDPFGDLLDRTVAGRSSQQRRLAVRRLAVAELAQAGGCHVAFVSRSVSSTTAA
jgi:hypothetical protein